MNITFVTDTYSPQLNGVAITLGRLADGLLMLGHSVDVIMPSSLSSADNSIKIPSVSLPRYPEVRIGFPAGSKLRKKWLKDRPDVIYVAIETPLGASAVSIARSLKIPVATGFHTNLQDYMPHYHFGFLGWATLPYLKRIHNRANKTFVPTLDMILEMENKGFRNLAHLPRGVDTALFSPEKRDSTLRTKWGATKSNPIGIYVGRIAPEKNLPLVVKTFREAQKQNPDFVGVFVGDGPLLRQLKDRNPEFIFVGEQRGEQLARSYASADLFVFPSTTETFGNVTLEAMASGLAVLAYDYAAARHHIEDGSNGFKVALDDESAFIERALEMVASPNLNSVKRAARLASLEKGWDAVVEVFENDLTSMIEGLAPVK